MATLLFIEASPRKERSVSLRAVNNLLEAYVAENPDDILEKISVWDIDLPEVDEALLAAKYAVQHKLPCTTHQAEKWDRVVKLAKSFVNADQYIISVPMWNFSIPYKLKHFIDVVTQSGLTFTYSKTHGYQGLLREKPVTLLYAANSGYPNGEKAFKVQKQHMEMWLNFLGTNNIRSLRVNSLGKIDGAECTLHQAE